MPQRKLLVKIQGVRVLVFEEKPHPVKSNSITLPLALFDYKNGQWLLLFRGSNGSWQPLPGEPPGKSLDEQVEIMIADNYQVFWDQ